MIFWSPDALNTELLGESSLDMPLCLSNVKSLETLVYAKMMENGKCDKMSHPVLP